jgi:hypothetical protein
MIIFSERTGIDSLITDRNERDSFGCFPNCCLNDIFHLAIGCDLYEVQCAITNVADQNTRRETGRTGDTLDTARFVHSC